MKNLILTREEAKAIGGYGSIDGINQSLLKEMLVSPLQCEHRQHHAKEQTSSMALGTISHSAILEADRLLNHYAMWDRKTAAGATAPRRGQYWDAFCEENAGKTIVTEAEFITAMALRDAVRSDPVARRYLKRGHPEAVMHWVDARTGERCKGRVDWLDTGVIVDLKITQVMQREKFFTHVVNLGWDFQAAFYSHGYRAVTGNLPAYKIVAASPKQPHDVAVYDVPPEFLEEDYENQVVPALRDYQQCRDANDWPGIANGCELTLQRPRWMRQESLEEL